MIASTRFSDPVYLPDVNKRLGLAMGLLIGLLIPIPVLLSIGVVVFLPARYSVGNWGWPEYTQLSVVLFAIVTAGVIAIRRRHRKRVRRLIDQWLAAAPRAPHEQAAADFYLALISARKPQRIAAVARFLAEVPVDVSRTLVLGAHNVRPVDDGTLFEEADGFEGRARMVPRWLLAVALLPFTIQFLAALSANGINPAYWSGRTFMLLVPVFFNVLMMLFAIGLIRPPGTVVMVTPRCIRYGSVRGILTFTPDDSVLLIGKYNRAIIAAIYRNDGKAAGVQYPSLETPGLIQLVNRWCMLTPLPAETPTPPAPVAADAPHI